MGTSLATRFMHTVVNLLETPVILILLLLMAVGLVVAGSFVVEYFTEHRRMKEKIPAFITELEGKSADKQKELIEASGLLTRQKKALLELLDQSHMPAECRESLAAQLLYEEESHYQRIVQFTDIIVRIAPMFGLLGTLIPLGPGLTALSSGDTTTLSYSLMSAFDTTATGLIVAAVTFVVSTLRKRWYDAYTTGLETIMDILLSDRKEEEKKGESQTC